MKRNYTLFLALLLMCMSFSSYSQDTPLGTCASFLKQVTETSTSARQTGSTLPLTVPDGQLTGKINYQTISSDAGYIVGNIEGIDHSTFFIHIEGGALTGHIILQDSKTAYRYYSDDSGMAYIESIDIHKLLCIDYEEAPARATTHAEAKTAISESMKSLESYPGGRGCVLLDFDGEYVSGTPWNGGDPIDAAASTISDANIQLIWEIVAEDYRPFHINITTNEAVFNQYPKGRRMRVIFTSTNTAAPGSGGVAYLGSFKWYDDTPCWVFNTSVKGAGDAASHEVGHTFNLSHDGRTDPSEGYYSGQGDWAPIMGTSYYVPVAQWSKGEYTSANNTQDDLAMIAADAYGVGYRDDDHGSTQSTATALGIDGDGNATAKGNIEQTGEIDMFSFTTTGGTVSLGFEPVTHHPDLNILATLYDDAGTTVLTSDDLGLSTAFETTLTAGTYYLSVTGTGEGDPLDTGYTNYASLGEYYISGAIPGTANTVATFYQDCSYNNSTDGYSIGLLPGSYTAAQLEGLGISDDDVSSITVESGYEVVLYKEDFFMGDTVRITSDISCLSTLTWNDSTSSIRVRSTTNALPTVSVTTPESGAILPTVNAVIRASANDPDGNIAKVQFYKGTTLLGESTVSPYTLTWTNGTAGSYTITVIATDDRGGQASTDISISLIDAGATFYEDCRWGGYSVSLGVGTYTLAQLQAAGIENDDISSLYVYDGYEVVVYQNSAFNGTSYVVDADVWCMTATPNTDSTTVNINDWISSLEIRTSTSTSSTSSEALAGGEVAASEEMISTLTFGPNPVKDYLTIHYGDEETLKVSVLSTSGIITMAGTEIKNGDTINLSKLQPGLYLVRVLTSKAMVTQKIIKE